MPYRLPNGRIVTEDMSFEVGDVIFPRGAIKFCSPQELADMEITWVDPEPEPAPVIDLEWLKGELSKSIDSQAEEIRLRFITPGAGMAMTYQEKLAQARAFQANGGAPEDYPFLAASIGIEAPDLASVAAVVVNRYTAWAQIGAQIEAVRLSAKKAIAEAADVASTRAAAEGIDWGV